MKRGRASIARGSLRSGSPTMPHGRRWRAICTPTRADRPPRPGRGRPRRTRGHRPVRAHGRGLRCLRGIDTLTALGLCSEIGEWERFDHPDQLSAYLGIVPSEHTTGAQRRLGSITKAGSTHARRLLVEAAYHYRRGPVVGEALERRQRGQAPEVINISWRAQRRLNARWRQLKTPAKNRTGSSPSRSPESSRRSAGRSPPGPLVPIGFRRHPCRRATPSRTQPRFRTSKHQRPAKDSPTPAD